MTRLSPDLSLQRPYRPESVANLCCHLTMALPLG